MSAYKAPLLTKAQVLEILGISHGPLISEMLAREEGFSHRPQPVYGHMYSRSQIMALYQEKYGQPYEGHR